MSCRRYLLTGLLVFGFAATVQADVDPTDTDSNILILVISRPMITYHDGDTIEYTVTVSVPLADIGFGKPARQEDVVVTFFSPDGVSSVTFPTIPSINRGESHIFTSADDALLGYTIVHTDEVSKTVTADSEAESAVAHTTSSDIDFAEAGRNITTEIVHPSILIIKSADPTVICDGVETDVTYTYLVSWGSGADVNLVDVVVTDDMCNPVVRQDDDTGNDDDVLEDGETWVYECETSISAETTNIATVDAEDVSGFDVSDTDTVTITANESPSVRIDPDSGEICDGEVFEFCAVASGGTPPYTYVWEKDGSFFDDVICINPTEAGEYCVIVTDALGCESPEACATLVVNENPTCSISEDDPPECPSEGGNFLTVTPSGGAGGYVFLWSVEGTGWTIVSDETASQIEYAIAEGADECALFTVLVVDSKGCANFCVFEVCCQPLFCRFTGGGVGTDTTETVTAVMLRNGGDIDRAQFGGQAGANTALPPQPAGEWTHHQQRGLSGKFTFHGGTSSAPEGTEIDAIRCMDPGGCSPSGNPPSPAKQLDFDGIGTFKNIGKGNNVPEWEDPAGELKVTAEGRGNKAFDGTFHWFEVNIDDLGEPGNKDQGGSCPDLGFGEKGGGDEADCLCPDFYRITIYNGAHRDDVVWENGSIDPTSLPRGPGNVIYEFFTYIDGGNLQIHRLTGFDTK